MFGPSARVTSALHVFVPVAGSQLPVPTCTSTLSRPMLSEAKPLIVMEDVVTISPSKGELMMITGSSSSGAV